MPDIADRYELIARMDDLHTGDSHLIADLYQQQSQAQDFTGMDTEGEQINRTVSLVLCVVQSVYDRYLSTSLNTSTFLLTNNYLTLETISKSSLEKCLKRIRMVFTMIIQVCYLCNLI